jgi:hypothetical protein
MENRWILIITLIVLLCIPLQVTAYNNTNAGGHPSINRYAIDYFEMNILPNDPLLAGTSIHGEASYGLAWDETDGRANTGPRHLISERRSKLLQNWIIEGGYSADEPEYTMALVHFYDPANVKEPWLTDPWFIMNNYAEFLARAADPSLAIPDLSAVQWAFDGWGTSGEQGAYFIQDYSWNDGLRYYKDALADPSRMNYKYGQAWRAVGETMHLVSDMTVPAHVRNDGHPTLNEDPYEESVGSRQVYAYKDGQPLALNYDQGTLRDVMVRIATSVNKNFYSADTMPIFGKDTLTGVEYFMDSYSQPSLPYSQPSLVGLTPDAKGYYYSPVAGALAREMAPPLFHKPEIFYQIQYVYRIDQKVLNDQRKVLIPTAIRGSAEVLDRFLPRFEARLSIEKYLPEDPSDEQYAVYTTLKQVHSEPDSWSGYDLIVRNGAYMVETAPDGTQTEKPLSLNPVWVTPPTDPNFNEWKDLFKFKPGTRVYMKYDLGGYVIKSNEVLIPWPTPTPTATATSVTSTVPPTYQPVAKASWGCADTAGCTMEGNCPCAQYRN